MDHFFKGEGRAIVRREVERMKPQVTVCFSSLALLLRFVICSLSLVVVQLQAKADAIAEPILKEVPATAAAEDGPRGKGANAKGSHETADGAPAPKDPITRASVSRAAGEV